MSQQKILAKQDVRKLYLDEQGNVDFNKIQARWDDLKKFKVSLANKHYTQAVVEKVKTMPAEDQQRFLDIMIAGLTNDDSSVGISATRPEDYDVFLFYLEPLIREYHKIEGETKQEHDWNIPVGEYVLTKIDPALEQVSMRARVARNVVGYNLPSSMDKDERIKFENQMETVFENFGIPGNYYSLTPGHKNFISDQEADELRKKHFLFIDMTSDNYLMSNGVASDWPFGRGIWVSQDETKMVWVGEEDQLRIISIVQGNDLGKVDQSLHELLTAIEKSGLKFAEHPVFGIITTCPTNMRTGKRQSILGKFPNLSKSGTDEANLKEKAKSIGLQVRGTSGEHSSMDQEGTADISPFARFGVTEANVTKGLFEGLIVLYQLERTTIPEKRRNNCCITF
ncbi:unnamed protein product (macronuclear) [Paramecium tetraurelia]|uniref:Phosphagen kinase C-terminal domain-containing protein n=1 Tax=Paramecium tetraurelia TaxID=5888 RepID=A0CMM0_PARTE|nr:uncharacterized protein GSPATT00008516001 [Paramecium tetraurelia]CAK72037.1 unnamed protein product [Paramecium tetraurelia]|eukprot:XP_001439434.1 hypothetical protein (macronuclear) [Paramecium tetraurelia strain d4-2]